MSLRDCFELRIGVWPEKMTDFAKRQVYTFQVFQRAFLICCSLSLLLMTDNSNCVSNTNFVESQLCDLDLRLTKGCTLNVTRDKTRGFTECAFICAEDNGCIGASMDETGDCFIHQNCQDIANCLSVNSDQYYMEKKVDDFCSNGGVREKNSDRCQCVDGWVGTKCQDYPQNCNDLLNASYTTEKIHRATLDFHRNGSYLIPVLCSIHSTRTNTLIMVNAGDESFNKSWLEYKYGFYIDKTHFWIGLEHMRKLNRLEMFRTMRIKILFDDGGTGIIKYRDVEIEGEANDYAIKLKYRGEHIASRYDITLGDCFADAINTPFSTWDRFISYGPETTNCAALYGMGWWFDSSCSPECNLFGRSDKYIETLPIHTIMYIKGVDLAYVSVNRIIIEID